MKRSEVHSFLVLFLLGSIGCRASPPSEPERLPPEAVVRHRQALILFDRGEYKPCVEALRDWLGRHEAAQPDLGASARFFLALSHHRLGETGKARDALQDICRRYAARPDTDPASRWRRWAEEQLRILGE